MAALVDAAGRVAAASYGMLADAAGNALGVDAAGRVAAASYGELHKDSPWPHLSMRPAAGARVLVGTRSGHGAAFYDGYPDWGA